MFTCSCPVIPETTKIETGINVQEISVAMMRDKKTAQVNENDQGKTGSGNS
jgi:hypothetical protein